MEPEPGAKPAGTFHKGTKVYELMINVETNALAGVFDCPELGKFYQWGYGDNREIFKIR